MSIHRTSLGERPLLSWGTDLRAARARRRRHRRLWRRYGLALGLLAAAVNWTIVYPPAPRLVWNASSSAPVGLYSVDPGPRVKPFHRGDMVIARLPPPWRDLAASRRYLPANVPLVKRVAAASGDEICGAGDMVRLNGRPLVRRLVRDRARSILPWWNGCLRLGSDDYLLVMPGSAWSFDGRYFGITKGTEIIGLADLLWAR
ncbi:S26 family signal peptidase [Novosphingobium kaempferiae]|uniref:S26 family signal peptidase n=1 Tax=Novosphingobium kaempferiae TaxID=2896849 RepID=UPI001E3FCF6F|nr:S26 family signal peptidase [Novosphingobium kaempferiae]